MYDGRLQRIRPADASYWGGQLGLRLAPAEAAATIRLRLLEPLVTPPPSPDTS